MADTGIKNRILGLLFGQRMAVLIVFALVTLAMAFLASRMRVDASFEKNIPLTHEYMQTYLDHREEFGSANRVLIALEDTSGDIFNKDFFAALNEATDEVSAISAVHQPQVKSLFTPNTRYIEAVEGGLAGGPVVPAEFDGSSESLEIVRQNALKAGLVGRMIANDFSAAMVTGQLLPTDPGTRADTDFVDIAHQLESIRGRLEQKYPDVKVHIIGFAKMIGDVSDGAQQVLLFFLIAFVITAILVYWYSHSVLMTLLPLFCSVIAVIWQLGLLTLGGFGLDPMSILVPFLVFAIGVSHGVQMINATGRHIAEGMTAFESAKASCARLLVPGGIALLSDTIGFLTLLFIEIDIIRELAITASLGVAVIILTNLILLPLLLSYVRFKPDFADKVKAGARKQDGLWRILSHFATQPLAGIALSVAILLGAFGFWQAQNLKIGELHAGAPALRPDSTYNVDTAFITENFSIGTDVMSVMVETVPNGCTHYDIMNEIDEFQWYVQNVDGVQSAISLPSVAKVINAAFNEGNLKWKILPREEATLVQSIRNLETSSGLFNDDCSVMPVLIFTRDHKAETINGLVSAIKTYVAERNPGQLENADRKAAGPPAGDEGDDASAATAEAEGGDRFNLPESRVRFRLASDAVGVMAATNESVEAAQFPMLAWVYSAVILLCLLSFRSLRATLCVVLPLALVSILAQALMTFLDIGLTVATLPVVALGVGIGVDYGIYIFTRMADYLRAGEPVGQAYLSTLRLTGNAVLFTGLTLAIGVSTWIFSPLQFQADMGVLLTFMFLVNMLGAVFLLPALAALFYRNRQK